jgi:hypothetical protein
MGNSVALTNAVDQRFNATLTNARCRTLHSRHSNKIVESTVLF